MLLRVSDSQVDGECAVLDDEGENCNSKVVLTSCVTGEQRKLEFVIGEKYASSYFTEKNTHFIFLFPGRILTVFHISPCVSIKMSGCITL